MLFHTKTRVSLKYLVSYCGHTKGFTVRPPPHPPPYYSKTCQFYKNVVSSSFLVYALNIVKDVSDYSFFIYLVKYLSLVKILKYTKLHKSKQIKGKAWFFHYKPALYTSNLQNDSNPLKSEKYTFL